MYLILETKGTTLREWTIIMNPHPNYALEMITVREKIQNPIDNSA